MILLNGSSGFIDAHMVYIFLFQNFKSPQVLSQFEFSNEWGNDPTKEFFIKCIKELSSLDLLRFIKWTTGLACIPYGGFEKKIKIVPRNRFYAHTCITVWYFEMERFNSYERFKEKFLMYLASSVNATLDD